MEVQAQHGDSLNLNVLRSSFEDDDDIISIEDEMKKLQEELDRKKELLEEYINDETFWSKVQVKNLSSFPM